MSNIKKIAAIVATMFVQFRDASTDRPLFALNEDGSENKDQPIGVRVYGPGSTQYRNAQSAIATANIKRGKKGLTGDTLRENETELLARTTYEFVNFDYEGAASSRETNAKFYDDVELAHLREQVVEKQGDFGNFLPTASNA